MGKKQLEDMYLVAGMIRVMGSHNLTWRYDRKLLKKAKKSFPLQYGQLKIEKNWGNKKALIEHLPNVDTILLIKNIQEDVERN